MQELNPSLQRYKGVEGFICLSFCNEEIGYNWNDIYTKDLNEANNIISEQANINNCYVNVATYKSERHNQENVHTITAHYLDIDNHLSPFSLDQAKQFERAFLKPLYDNVIPTPSQILYTGRGLQILFNLKQAHNIPKYKQTQLALCQTLQKELEKVNVLLNVSSSFKNCNLSVDQLIDTRALRVAKTINTKARKQSVVIFQSNYIYTQDNIISNFSNLEYVTGKGKTKQTHVLSEIKGANDEEILKLSDSKLKEFKPYNKLFTADTINLYRRKDLQTLIELRNAKNYLEGYRNTLIRIYVQLCKEYVTNYNELINQVQTFNTYFKQPLKDSEIINWCKCSITKQIHFTNAYIVQALNITKEEQKELKVLLSYKERMARYYQKHQEEHKEKRKQRYKGVKEAHSKQKEERNTNIVNLLNEGYNYTQIALKLDISKKTIQRVKATYEI